MPNEKADRCETNAHESAAIGSADGAFGAGILEVADESDARHVGENDPSVRADLNRFEFYPMRSRLLAPRVETPGATHPPVTVQGTPSAAGDGPLFFFSDVPPGNNKPLFIVNLPNRSTNHAAPVPHLLREGLFGHVRYKVQPPFRSRGMHVAEPHTAVFYAERLNLCPYPRQSLALDHVDILRSMFLQIRLENGP
jgi:hypothetical protein